MFVRQHGRPNVNYNSNHYHPILCWSKSDAETKGDFGNGNGYAQQWLWLWHSSTVLVTQLVNHGGKPLILKLFMFDADTSSLSGVDDYLMFNDTDTITATLSVPGHLGPNRTGADSNNRVSLATYRAMVKAKGPSDETAQYYAGTLYTVDLDAHPDSSTVYDMSETGAAATWTLMPNIEVDSGNALGQTNLTVDTSDLQLCLASI